METVMQGNTTTTELRGTATGTSTAQGSITIQSEPQKEGKTFTQEELDKIVGERLQRERQKYADYDDLKTKAAKFDEQEEANKSELQKATERADSLQKELDGLKAAESVRMIRESVAKEMNIPANLLTGSTEEECKEQAEAIKAYAKPAAYPSVRDGGEPQNTKGLSTREQFADWLNNQ